MKVKLIYQKLVAMIIAFFLISSFCRAQLDEFGTQPNLKVCGVKVFVKSLEDAKDFYVNFLGLEIEKQGPSQIQLKTGQYPIILVETDQYLPRNLTIESHYGISFLTQKLLPAIDRARQSGYTLYDTLLARNGVGIHIPISDPSGNMVHLMEVQVRETPRFNGFRLYNSGATINDMSEAEEFYKGKLGFVDWSRNYLPDALPLKHSNGSFAFMLHQDTQMISSTFKYGYYPGSLLMLQTEDLTEFSKYLKKEKISYAKHGEAILLRDNNNNVIEVIESP